MGGKATKDESDKGAASTKREARRESVGQSNRFRFGYPAEYQHQTEVPKKAERLSFSCMTCVLIRSWEYSEVSPKTKDQQRRNENNKKNQRRKVISRLLGQEIKLTQGCL